MKFQTYGPFPVPEVELKSDTFAEQFDDAKKGLNGSSGVYIFIDRGIPIYVGQAQKRSFGARIADHFNKPHNRKLKERLEEPATQASILLIALAKNNGELRKAETLKASHHAAIHRLEDSMIGACLAANPKLFNLSSVGFYRDTQVPGYLNSPSGHVDKSAKCLARLLRTKS